MKKSIILLSVLFYFISSVNNAYGETEKSINPFSIQSVTTDKNLRNREASFIFTCYDENRKHVSSPIKYSYNGKEQISKPDAEGKIFLKLAAGKYKFQFWLDQNHIEIYSDSVKAGSRTKTEVMLTFKSSTMIMIEDKPVIYLYPIKKTEIDVKLDLKGEMLFTYPVYKNGWKIEAEPDGTIKQDDKSYSYLFWEGKTEIKKKDINAKEGFVVSNEDLLSFFEGKLTKMGLSAKEQQDFITYWVPRMSTSKRNYIHFLFNNEFDEYAHLSITPKPDHLFRVFMIWDSLEEEQKPEIKEQEIPALTRKGFTVVEWGGAEVDYFTEENN